MADTRSRKFAREIVVVAWTFAAAVVVIPPVVAAVGYQSGQVMFWPAIKSLYTYFLPYTLGACVVLAVLFEAVRVIVRHLKKTEPETVSRDGRD